MFIGILICKIITLFYCFIVIGIYICCIFTPDKKNTNKLKYKIMTNLSNTTQNTNLVKALKTVNSCKWTGSTSFDDIDKCLRSINMQTSNSGHYTPTPIKLKGMTGIYLVNEDGGLCYEFRILNKDNKFTIESLTSSGYSDFETEFSKLQ